MAKIRDHRDLQVYQKGFASAMEIFELSKSFPPEEKYSLTDQIRRSSRSTCANTAEGFRKRKYPAAFVAKISDAETEAAETQVWLEFAHACGYIDQATFERLDQEYHHILGKLVNMRNKPENWTTD
jgi:four helix bundle protein